MKCKICGCEEFIAHQVCHEDIVVDGNGQFTEDIDGGVYDSDTPYGPYTCTRCGAVYDELDESTMSDSPEDNWEEKNALYKKIQDCPTSGGNGRFQQWQGKYYEVCVVFGNDGFRFISIANTSEGYGMPYLKVDTSDAGTDHVIVQFQCNESMDTGSCQQWLRQLETALEAAQLIENLFVISIKEGTFDRDSKFLYRR